MEDVAAGTVYLKHQDAYVQLYAVEGSDLRAVCISDFSNVLSSVPQTPTEGPYTVEEEEPTEKQARRAATRAEIADMTDSEEDECKTAVLTAAPKNASRAFLRGERVRVLGEDVKEKPEERRAKPKGTVGEELARGKAVAQCEAYTALESRADKLKERYFKHRAKAPGENEFEDI